MNALFKMMLLYLISGKQQNTNLNIYYTIIICIKTNFAVVRDSDEGCAWMPLTLTSGDEADVDHYKSDWQ